MQVDPAEAKKAAVGALDGESSLASASGIVPSRLTGAENTVSASSSTPSRLVALPAPLLCHCAQFLSLDELAKLLRTCADTSRELSASEPLWRQLFTSTWPHIAASPKGMELISAQALDGWKARLRLGIGALTEQFGSIFDESSTNGLIFASECGLVPRLPGRELKPTAEQVGRLLALAEPCIERQQLGEFLCDYKNREVQPHFFASQRLRGSFVDDLRCVLTLLLCCWWWYVLLLGR
jgi:hypothetical protein